MMLAWLVRPDTHAGLAAKARIYHSMRHALVGCVVEESQPLLESIAEDVARLSGERTNELWAKDDALLIRTASEVERLSKLNDAAWASDQELPSNDPKQIVWLEKARKAQAAFLEAVALLASIAPRTPVGMARKASVASSLSWFQDHVSGAAEGDLLFSVAADAQRFGAGMASPVGDDAALLSLGRYFEAQWRQERIVSARNGSDEAIKIETDRTEDLVTRIRDLPATTPAGWHVKARAIAWTCSGDVSDVCLPDMAMVASLLRDLGAIEGGGPSAPKLPDPDRYLLAHHAPFYAAWKVEREAAAVLDNGDGEASEAHEKAADTVASVTRNIESFPATSIEGLKLKAAALSYLYPDEEITSDAITGLPGRNATDIYLIVQIIRDLRALVDEPVVPALPQFSSAAETLEQAA